MWIFYKKSFYFVESVVKAELVIDAFKKFKKFGQSFAEKKLSKVHQKWSPLPAHVVKVYVDPTIRYDENIIGLEVVIKDSCNKIIAATIQQTQLGRDVKYTAVEAVKWGFR
ncbi:hypothetical protein CUMW_259690 [Citrus unshiu]|uniref:RNase H type-1 domain-containing protein n=1 Tax=Citrus unshiu TaxID=55188 RepID=A0A2H5QU71_CITUN|nr:hypothetical protein CUMW_259690 [Citrus unshiu]